MNNNHSLCSLRPLLLCFFLFFSCSRHPNNYASFMRFERGGWRQQQNALCEVLIEDTLSLFHIDITGSINYFYFFDSLSVVLTVSAPSGESFADTLSFGFTKDRRNLCEDFRFPYCSQVQFKEAGVWKFSFHHNMGVGVLRGVWCLGVFVEIDEC